MAASVKHPNMQEQLSPTVVPSQHFLPSEDAAVLRKAMKGLGTDEKAIIDLLTKRSFAQRQQIIPEFQKLYNRDLVKDLKSELSGNFLKVVVALMTPLLEFYAKELYEATKGLGTDENALIEILCSLSNAQIEEVKKIYQNKYKTSLESDIKGDTSGQFQVLLTSLCSAKRDESTSTDPDSARADAKALYDAGVKRWGTEESTFNRILCCTSYIQLRLVFHEYETLSTHDIAKDIGSEFSGDTREGYLAIVDCALNKTTFFAKQLHKSMKGLGTNDRALVRLVVTRCEIDMGEIKKEYVRQYSRTLADDIKGDCSGDYRKCLLALIGEE